MITTFTGTTQLYSLYQFSSIPSPDDVFGGIGVFPLLLILWGGMFVGMAVYYKYIYSDNDSASHSGAYGTSNSEWTEPLRNVSNRIQTAATNRIKPEASDATTDTTAPGQSHHLKNADSELIAQAQELLKEDGKEITGANLETKIRELKETRENFESEIPDGATGLVTTDELRKYQTGQTLGFERVEEHPDHLVTRNELGDKIYRRVLQTTSYPHEVSINWLHEFTTSGIETDEANINLSLSVRPQDTPTIRKKLQRVKRSLLMSLREKRRKSRVDTVVEETKLDEVHRLDEGLQKGTNRILDASLLIEIVAPDKTTLDNATKELKQKVATSGVRVAPYYDNQLPAFQSVAPYGRDRTRNYSPMDLEALTGFYLFTDPNIMHPSGVLFGINEHTKEPVIIDRFRLSGYNMVVTAKIGSGKSFFSGLVAYRHTINDPGELETLIIDPRGGFNDLVKGMKGEIIDLASDIVINPLEIEQVNDASVVETMEGHPYSNKIDSVIGMLQAHFSSDAESATTLPQDREGVARRALHYTYLEKGIKKEISTHSRESPTMEDFRNILLHMSQGEDPRKFLDVPEDCKQEIEQRVDTIDGEYIRNERREEHANALNQGLEDFAHGGQYDNLTGKSNVSLNKDIVSFDLSDTGETDESLYMHIVVDWLFQRAKTSDKEKVIIIDECHNLFRSPHATRMLNKFTRRSRHYDAGMTLITQTVDEFMRNPQAKDIYDQCDIKALLHHEDIDEETMRALNLSGSDVNYIRNADTGQDSEYSQALLKVSGIGKIHLSVLSDEFELALLDKWTDAMDWSLEHGLLYEHELTDEDLDSFKRTMREFAQPESETPTDNDRETPESSDPPIEL